MTRPSLVHPCRDRNTQKLVVLSWSLSSRSRVFHFAFGDDFGTDSGLGAGCCCFGIFGVVAGSMVSSAGAAVSLRRKNGLETGFNLASGIGLLTTVSKFPNP